ncbi:heterokaryon incompatibility protein-domain-containing protein [Truncatella angustata]|uniref:Heterokaryon incompatibility protein-domain-containing protein n=1 Tax=Truncatella angustata TaxID=152316 RepID=A0A9P8UPZ0_9PEZI|nr:heterokaryon incompatibility protein-domain-containing protein [Truncatella angustata]KAH6655924.1 heterokaryon incompatibility protein-domain-containing protein [Truncatella angustata]
MVTCEGVQAYQTRRQSEGLVSGQGQLRGRIRRATIGDAPPFVAISHVWGDRKFDRSIHLDSGCGVKYAQISPNLEALLTKLLCLDSAALPQLWEEGSKLLLWVDMICINQIDVGEKASQIPLMRNIYSQARSVLIWINEDSSHVHHAFRYLRQIITDLTVVDTNRSVLFDPKGWDAIKHLLNCDWFHRRWVLQESVVPKDAVFLCGSEVMPIKDLFDGVDVVIGMLLARPQELKVLHVAHVGSVRPVLALRELKKRYASASSPSTLLWLLEHFRFTRTTLAHDQIYSLLGLCSPDEVAGNPIRYDLEPEDVYKTFVASHVQLYTNLEFLGLCTPAQRDNLWSGPLNNPISRPFGGPSWVPNWHSGRLRRCLGLSSLDPNVQFFNASNTLPTTMSFQGNELIVSGVQLDKIRVFGNFCQHDQRSELSNTNSRLFQQYFDFWMTATGVPMPYKDRQCMAETFTRTLSLLGIYLDPVPSPIDIPDMFCRWCSDSILGRRLAEYGLKPNSASDGNGQKAFIRMKRLMSWDPFITKGGYIGLAREQCRVGDEIWLIGGCSVPLILSPQTENPGYYRVNGEVFIDGFMFGEKASTIVSNPRLIRRITLI